MRFIELYRSLLIENKVCTLINEINATYKCLTKIGKRFNNYKPEFMNKNIALNKPS